MIFSLFFAPGVFKSFLSKFETLFNENVFVVDDVFHYGVWLEEFCVVFDVEAIANYSQDITASFKTALDILDESFTDDVADDKNDFY